MDQGVTNQCVQGCLRLDVAADDRARRRWLEPSSEDGQAAQGSLSVVGEPVEAPADGVLHRAVAGREAGVIRAEALRGVEQLGELVK